MQTQEIERDQWRPFLDQFSRKHLGEPVTVVVLTKDAGPERVATDLPLVGIVDDPKSSDGESIEIVAGESSARNVVHEIFSPSRVRVARQDDGSDVALEFESGDAPPTIVHFGGTERAVTFGA